MQLLKLQISRLMLLSLKLSNRIDILSALIRAKNKLAKPNNNSPRGSLKIKRSDLFLLLTFTILISI
jgi:hypothetical protein